MWVTGGENNENHRVIGTCVKKRFSEDAAAGTRFKGAKYREKYQTMLKREKPVHKDKLNRILDGKGEKERSASVAKAAQAKRI